jgi:hypothetical protein
MAGLAGDLRGLERSPASAINRAQEPLILRLRQTVLFSFINFLGSNGTGDFFIFPGLPERWAGK